MFLYGPNSQTALLESDDDGGLDYMSMISRTFAAGTYYVKVMSAQNNISGTFSIRVTSGSKGAITPIAVNGTSLGGNIASGGDFNWYSFQVTVPGTYSIETFAGTLKSSYLYLFGPNTQEQYLDEAGDLEGISMATLSRALDAGTYYFKVEGRWTTDSGSYQVRVRSAIQGAPLNTNGAWASGSISASAPYNWFQFTVPSSGDYLVETFGGDLGDSVLYLYGPNTPLTLVASNDDVNSKNSMSQLILPLKAGTYYARVEGFVDPRLGPGTGSFNIRVLRLPFQPSTPLTVNAPATAGSISFGGKVDWYSFTVTTRDSYIIEILPGSLTSSYLRLFGPGSQVALLAQNGGAGKMGRVIAVLAPGTYYLKAQGFTTSDTGTYTIQVRAEVTPLTVDAPPITRAISSGTDIHWYSFVVPATGSYVIETAGGTLTDDYLRLYGPNLRDALIAWNRNAAPGKRAGVTRTLTPGTYYLKIQGYLPTNLGSYTLAVHRNIVPLTLNAAAKWSAIDPAGDLDWYSFTIAHRDRYLIETLPGALKSNYLRLYGPNSQAVLAAENGAAGKMASIAATLDPGTYYIKTQGYTAADLGTYAIQVRVVETPLVLDAPAIAKTIASGSDDNWFTFNVTAAGSYTIETTAGTLSDNFMRLFGPNSRDAILAYDNDGGAGKMAKITAMLAPGTYYVKVQGLTPSDIGSYSISLRQNVVPLTLNAKPFANAIEIAGGADWYSFTVTKRATYLIETWAGSLTDNIMRLYGPGSRTKLIKEDDNSGSGKMAKISRVLDPGIYAVMISANNPSATGNYIIRVSK